MNTTRTWLVFANRKKCRHAEALYELGYINWVMGRAKISVGDIVFLFMSDERRVRFKTVVSETSCERSDNDYWNTSVSTDLTYKLDYLSEYHKNLLDEKYLKEHGFNGGKSLELPICNNKELLSYISSVFDESTEQLTELIFQSEIQNVDLSLKQDIPDKSRDEPEWLITGKTTSVKRNARIAKQAIAHSNYCKHPVNHVLQIS